MSDAAKPSNGFQLPDAGIDLENLERNLIQQALKKAAAGITSYEEVYRVVADA